jgi:hypothetical protein
MNSRRKLLFIFVALLPLSLVLTCTPTTTCTTADGETADFSNPFGAWTQVTGYSTPKTEAELALSFDVLIVESGTKMCKTRVQNGVSQSTVFQATYTNDVNTKTLSISYADGGSDVARYSLTGGCSNPGLTLSYQDGTAETFKIRTKDLSEVSCSSGENP